MNPIHKISSDKIGLTKLHSWLPFILCLILVPLAGVPNFHPFNDALSFFRVSFGSPVFLLFILIVKKPGLLSMGCLTGASVVAFRGAADTLIYGSAISHSIYMHLPTLFYYAVFAFIFSIPKFNRESISIRAKEIAICAIISEIGASIAELLAMNVVFGISGYLTSSMLIQLSVIACLRSFFILSFFFLFLLQSTEHKMVDIEKKNEHMSMLAANLYEESFQMDISQREAEEITRDCYDLYENMQKSAPDDANTRKMLSLASRIHDIKKSLQRINAGLHQLTGQHFNKNFIPADDLLNIIRHTGVKYAKGMKKLIVIHTKCTPDVPELPAILVLSILNSLSSNAIEAIEYAGTIDISITATDGILTIKVENTGSFIPARRLKAVFNPGYTTKFDNAGNASTGIGLTYIMNISKEYDGSADIESDGKNMVCCTVRIPLDRIIPVETSKKR